MALSKPSARGDLTTGVIWKKLTLFAIPLLLTSVVQQLYNTVDLIFAGNLISSDASAAIGASGMLATCLVGFFGGMSVGSGVVVARSFGAGDRGRLRTAIHSTVALSAAGGLLLLCLGELLAPVYLRLINTPTALTDMARGYLRIYFLSIPAIVFYNLGSGILRSLGDSRSTLYAQLIGGLTNVFFDWLLIRILPNGVEGVAWATLFSQGVSAAFVVFRLTRLEPDIALRPKRVAFDGPTFRETVRIGVPAGLQAMVITLSNVVAQYHINSLGENAVAAFTAYFKVELIVYHPIVVLGQAVMTFSGQNLGARRFDRVKAGTRTGLLLALGVTVVTSAAGLILGKQLFRVFYGNPAAISLGLNVIHITFPFYFLYCFLQVLGDAMRGAGESRGPMRIVLLNICLIRTALLFLIVPRIGRIEGVALCYPITWALTAAGMALYYRRFRRERLSGADDPARN